MTREDIISMAREAGLTGLMEGGLAQRVDNFVALVAAAEREACAQICDAADTFTGDSFARAIRARGKNE